MNGFDLEGPASSEDGLFGINVAPEEAALVLVSAPFDATASYRRGAAGGPSAILTASSQVDLHDPNGRIESPFPARVGVAMLPEDEQILALNRQAGERVDSIRLIRAADSGNVGPAIAEVNALGAQLNLRVRDIVDAWLTRGKKVGLIGGDHATALGAILAHRDHHPNMGVLQIDAHADLRQAYEGLVWSHASVMYNLLAAVPDLPLVQWGVRDLGASEHLRIQRDPRVTAFFAPRLAARRFEGEPFAAIADEILGALPQEVYVTFDIDGLDPASCPHTGTPVPGGLQFDEVTYLLGRIVTSGRRLVGFDLVEVAPGPAGDEYDGNVGARILFFLCRLCLAGNP